MLQMSSNISVDIGSSSGSLPEDIVSISSLLINGGTVELSAYFLTLSASPQVLDNLFLVSDNKPPS